MSPRGGSSGAYGLLKKAGAAAAATLAILTLAGAISAWALSEIQKPIRLERAEREKSIGRLIAAQNQTNETLLELVTVMVAPEAVRLRTMRRLQAKYEIGVTR